MLVKLIYLTMKHIDFSKDTRPLVRFYRIAYMYSPLTANVINFEASFC